MTGYNADISQPRERDEDETVTTTDGRYQVRVIDQQPHDVEIMRLRSEVNVLSNRVLGLESKRDMLSNYLTSLGENTLSLAESLDYEIGDELKDVLKELADHNLIDLPTKTVTLTGTVTRVYTYGVDVEVPIFDDEDDIDHREHESTIIENLDEVWDLIDTTIEAD